MINVKNKIMDLNLTEEIINFLDESYTKGNYMVQPMSLCNYLWDHHQNKFNNDEEYKEYKDVCDKIWEIFCSTERHGKYDLDFGVFPIVTIKCN